MSAAHQGAVRQRRQGIQGVLHLLRRAFKQPTAAAREQRIAAKQHGLGLGLRAVESDMSAGVPGDVDDLPGPPSVCTASPPCTR